MDSEANAAQLVSDWKKSKKRIDKNMRSLAAEERQKLEKEHQTIRPTCALVDRLSMSVRGKTVELKLSFDINKEEDLGACYRWFRALVRGYSADWRRRHPPANGSSK